MMNPRKFRILQDLGNIQSFFRINFRNQTNEDRSNKEGKMSTVTTRNFTTGKNEGQRRRERSALEIWEEIEELASES